MTAPVTLGPYRILSKVADGGFGSVFAAVGADGRRVAVKLLRALDPEAVARFERERRLLASLGEADGFVPLLDAGSSPEGPWLAMPFLEGGTLRDRLKREGPLEPGAALALGRELARALARAHALGIAHRDLKPENVLFGSGGRPLIADLGLAKHFRAVGTAATPTITRPDIIAGTIGYMAPEQIEDARSANAAADVFALGVIVYECLAGATPFDSSGVLSFVQSVSTGKPKSLHARGVAVPAGAEGAILRALERDPRRRFPDGLAFGRALELGKAAPSRRVALVALAGLLVVLGLLVVAAVAAADAVGVAPTPRRPTPSPASPPRRVASAPAPPPVAADPFAPIEKALAAKQFQETERLADAVLATSEANARALTLRGRARLGAADLERACDDFRRAVAVEPTLERLLLLGEHARSLFDRTKKPDLARESIEADGRALELDPKLAGVSFRRAMTCVHGSRDWSSAAANFEQACVHDPKNSNYHAHRGWALANAQRIDHALAALDRALDLDPGNLLAHRWRSEIREALGDLAGAIQDIEAILALDPPGGSQRELVEPRLARIKARVGK